MASVHDSLLTGYAVDGRNRCIVLHTEPHQGGGSAFIDLVFRGVAAYHLEGDCLRNIVFDVCEVPPGQIVGDGARFLQLFELTGWPEGWDPKRQSAVEFLSRPGLKVFELSCSYGMSGWIAAESLERRQVPGPHHGEQSR